MVVDLGEFSPRHLALLFILKCSNTALSIFFFNPFLWGKMGWHYSPRIPSVSVLSYGEPKHTVLVTRRPRTTVDDFAVHIHVESVGQGREDDSQGRRRRPQAVAAAAPLQPSFWHGRAGGNHSTDFVVAAWFESVTTGHLGAGCGWSLSREQPFNYTVLTKLRFAVTLLFIHFWK